MIDVWNAATFDADLITKLNDSAEIVKNYVQTENDIFLSYDLGRSCAELLCRPENRYAHAFMHLEEMVGTEMAHRSIRAFHYTRLTDDEVGVLRRDGVHLSTPETLRSRLKSRVLAGDISPEVADAIYSGSPFHSNQRAARSNKFWMTSHPVSTDNHEVKLLLDHWGGEVSYFFSLKEADLVARLTNFGVRRVIELKVPLAVTRHSYSASKAVIATFARSIGCIPEKCDFNLYVIEALPPCSIMAVHSEGDVNFTEMGRRYPDGYLDVNIGRWKELTGEDD